MYKYEYKNIKDSPLSIYTYKNRFQCDNLYHMHSICIGNVM